MGVLQTALRMVWIEKLAENGKVETQMKVKTPEEGLQQIPASYMKQTKRLKRSVGYRCPICQESSRDLMGSVQVNSEEKASGASEAESGKETDGMFEAKKILISHIRNNHDRHARIWLSQRLVQWQTERDGTGYDTNNASYRTYYELDQRLCTYFTDHGICGALYCHPHNLVNHQKTNEQHISES